jgi:hypothetical protein
MAATKEEFKLKIISYYVSIDLLPKALEGLPGFEPEVKRAIMERLEH